MLHEARRSPPEIIPPATLARSAAHAAEDADSPSISDDADITHCLTRINAFLAMTSSTSSAVLVVVDASNNAASRSRSTDVVSSVA